jgi:uncharacterized protein (TIGR02246 family)
MHRLETAGEWRTSCNVHMILDIGMKEATMEQDHAGTVREVSAEDQLAVIDVVHALCDALDDRSASAVAALFAPDGSFGAFGNSLVGPEAIAKGLDQLSGAPAQRHLASNVRVASSGDELVVDAVFSVYHFSGDGPLAPSIILQTSTRCRVVDGNWRISDHAGRPLSPMSMPGPRS